MIEGKNIKNNKKFIIGTAQFGAKYGIKNKHIKIKKNNAFKILKLSEKNNINHLDTSDAYRGYKKILSKYNLEKWKISLKLSNKLINRLNSEKKFLNFFYKNLKMINKKKFDYILFHDSKILFKRNGKKIYHYLFKLKKKGFVKKIGISAYTTSEVKSVIRKYKIDVIQIPLNIFDQRLIKKKFIKKLKSLKIEIHARSIFLQGLLLLDKKNIPKKFQKYNKSFIKWFEFLKKNKTSPLKECIKFAFINNFIDKYIIGVDSTSNLEDIVNLKIKNSKKNFETLKSNNIRLIDPRKW